MLYTNKLVAGDNTGITLLVISTKLIRGINTPDELDEMSKLDDEFGFAYTVETWPDTMV